MSTHAMIDLETLGTNPDCVILTLGAVKFNPYTFDEPYSPLHIRVDVDGQTEMGRTIDENTLAWWATQSDSVREEALSDTDRISLDDFTKQINRYCVGVDYLWCQGPLFDYAILQHLYLQLEKPAPWNYWQIRDSRTLFGLLPTDPRKEIQQELHNALADSYFQAKCVQKAYKHFGITR
jgi:hypothetical protein